MIRKEGTMEGMYGGTNAPLLSGEGHGGFIADTPKVEQRGPKDLDDYCPMEDTPTPAEKIQRRAPANDGKRGKSTHENEGGAANMEEGDITMEVVYGAAEVSHLTAIEELLVMPL